MTRSPPRKLRQLGRLAGLGYGAAVAAAAVAAAVSPQELDTTRVALLVAGALTAVLCVTIDWGRFGWAGMHAIALVGTAEIALAIEFFDHFANTYYLLVAVYVAGIFASRSQVFPHLAIVSLLIVAAIFYDPGNPRAHARFAAFMVPMVWLAAGMTLFVRERMRASVADYRRLAAEAERLGERIRRARRRVAEQEPETADPNGDERG